MVFTTEYASVRQLAAWALRLGEHARVLGPDELVAEIAERVELLHERHTRRARPRRRSCRADADRGGRRAGRRQARDRDPPGALRAPRHARQHPDPGRPGQRAPAVRRGLRGAADLRRRAARGRQRAQRRQLRRRLLRPLRRDPRRRDDRGRPRALLRQLRPSRAPAARRGQGADRRDRPDRRPPARGRAELGAREDRRRARRRPDGAGPAGRLRRRRRLRDRPRRLARDL